MTGIGTHLLELGTRIIGSKDALELLVDLSPDALHIHMSLLVLFAIALILRRRPDDWRPWLVLLVLEMINETNDILHHSMRVPLDDRAAALHDLLNTMFWPTLILIFGRLLFPPPVPMIIEPDPDTRDDDATDPSLTIIEHR
ncbi:hypothetical protein FSZ31_05885 [Sphingorhabdus soli]|uniref:Uncharacterized protein n=1 Tax=Flavisphingopyxis soli TaxID=2601267 RepID=A0A5C6UM57_9SPHN|nr:hypothetical protein [Sphingorhabdus soli]TXC74233.1 hypothetical protein FSZ31_05885 [Sphingorhabdus soli]